jgi:hypothetical protein
MPYPVLSIFWLWRTAIAARRRRMAFSTRDVLAFTALCALLLGAWRGLKPVPLTALTLVITFSCVATIVVGLFARLTKVAKSRLLPSTA